MATGSGKATLLCVLCADVLPPTSQYIHLDNTDFLLCLTYCQTHCDISNLVNKLSVGVFRFIVVN